MTTDSISGRTGGPAVFVKHCGSMAAAYLEAENSESGRAVSEGAERFIVPRLVQQVGAVLVFEHLGELTPLREWLARCRDTNTASRRVGEAGRILAAVHQRPKSVVPDGTSGSTNSRRFAENDLVAVHGDFAPSRNILVRESDEPLVVVDWTMPAWYPCASLTASSHWDLALFMVDLCYQRPRDPSAVRNTSRLCSSFLAHYAAVRHLDRRALRQSVASLTYLYYRKSFAVRHLSPVLRIPSSMRALWSSTSIGSAGP